MTRIDVARVGWLLLVCGAVFAQTSSLDPKPASATTIARQAQARAALPSDDGQDERFVHQGFIATAKDPLIRASDGRVVWNMGLLDWVQGDPPPTVNPSLWRQMKLLRVHGLFKVAEGVWQVRGFDGSNLSLVKGAKGWIVIDPLMGIENARAAIALINEQLGQRPISGVIYTHSHPDHFGGVRAFVDASSPPPPILAPERFMQETVGEYVIVGNAMGRRAGYQFGSMLKPEAQGYVGGGIVTTATDGTVTLLPPSDLIKHTGETRVIDGVTFEFQMVPETEAPAEMNLFLPAQRTLFISEIATCTMHNIQTPRGALVRDANRWAGYLTEALTLYGERSDALMTGHCWPRFGNEVIKNYLALQRDNYKFIHDQTVRRLNNGETPLEIAETLKRPAAIENEWSNHGYYGTVRHNAKGVYQRYIGWWDGIPAHLDLYPPTEAGQRYVRAMGGASGVLKEAQRAVGEGDYRWAAEILNHLVFAEPDNQPAKALLADSYEQLGYQAESAIWRNIYLSGAAELRQGFKPRRFLSGPAPDLVATMPTTSLFDTLATRLNPDVIGDHAMTIALDFTDTGERALVSVRNAVLVAEMGKRLSQPTVSMQGSRRVLSGFLLGKMPLEKAESAGLNVSGDRSALLALQRAIDSPAADYSIVTP